MDPQIIAASKFYGRKEYYDQVFESSEFELELYELADDFGTEYRLMVQYPNSLWTRTFEDKQAAIITHALYELRTSGATADEIWERLDKIRDEYAAEYEKLCFTTIKQEFLKL